MGAEDLRALIREVDRQDQIKARVALAALVQLGKILESNLELVTTVKRNQRKSLRHLTVQELIDMGLVTVVPSE